MPRVYANLKAYFRAEGYGTQQALARELGISTGNLSMIKWGTRQPKLGLALRIADRCHVPLESLIKELPKRKRRRVAKAQPLDPLAQAG